MKKDARLDLRVSKTIYNLVKEDAEKRSVSNSSVLREIIVKHYAK